jgi:hypothetical protein
MGQDHGRAAGGAALSAAYGIGAMFATSRGAGTAIADAAVGPKTVQERTAGSQGGISGGGGIGGGIRASGGINAR